MHLSVVIITKNEARNIGRCLDSLQGVADDIVVLDSGSTDETEVICRAKNARFFTHPFLGYSDQKNRANALALHPYILSIDADEALSERLKVSILAMKVSTNPAQAYRMSRITNYCGQWIHHSGWYPDRKTRIFDTRKGNWGGPNPHETVVMSSDSKVATLEGDLLHYSYYNTTDHYNRTKKYAEMAVTALKAQGKTAAWWQVYLSPGIKFLRNYVLKLGFLDGKAGFIICKVAALETYWKYSGLRNQ